MKKKERMMKEAKQRSEFFIALLKGQHQDYDRFFYCIRLSFLRYIVRHPAAGAHQSTFV